MYRFSLSGLRRDQDPPFLSSFVMLDAQGQRALLRRNRDTPLIWTDGEGGGAVAPCEAKGVVDFAAAPGGPLVALTAEEAPGKRSRMLLRAAQLEGDRLVLGEEVRITEAPRLEWTSAAPRQGGGWPEDWSEDEQETDMPPFDPLALNAQSIGEWGPWWRGGVRLSANRFGIGVSTTYSGIVAVLDPKTLQPRLTARVPIDREHLEVFVLPVPSGALITLVANLRHTEFIFVDEAGTVRAIRHQFGEELAWGSESPGFAWDEETALVSQTHSDDHIQALTLPALSARRFSREPGFLIDGGSTPDGSVHLLARTDRHYRRPHNWRLERWERKDGRFVASEVEMPDFRRSSAPPTPPALPRVDGTPAIGVAGDHSTRWCARIGATTTLRLQVNNHGGVANGLWVELGGAAIVERYVTVEAVALEDGTTSTPCVLRGSVARAELPEVTLEAGFAVPARAPYGEPMPLQPSLTLLLRVRAERLGQALMTVRIGPRGGVSTTGSGMVGRSFMIVEQEDE
ncbi:hypothetical protein [Chondromyces crocatus]|uniref:hypothetical protein n=1 Tax=Chondromyces crocatus TaxID=52 RepID=UPI0012E2F680|nr:hypothetical protein [Chondromyces crocatus]